MLNNPVIETMLTHKSIRKYKKEQPSDEEIHTIVRAGQQAPFSYQMCSVLLSRDRENHYFEAPLLFTICVDVHRLETVMRKRGWDLVTHDLPLLIFGIQDASPMAQNMVVAAASLGMGSCYIGSALYIADKIKKEYCLPQRVFPLVQLTMGYPDEDPPPRPRYPLDFTLFENEYPDFSEEQIKKAMEQMDRGYLDQDYYKKANYMVTLPKGKKETYSYDNYSWTEHISRKAGIWQSSSKPLRKQMKICGFDVRKPDIDEKQ